MPEEGAGGAGGVAFPLVGGRRSSTATGRAVVADAAAAVDPALAERVRSGGAAGEWRRTYVDAVRDLTAAGAPSAAAERAIARAGLASVHERFAFAGPSRELTLSEAMAAPEGLPLVAEEVVGEGAPPDGDLAIVRRQEVLRGDALSRELDRLVVEGSAEPSFAAAVGWVLTHPEALDLRDTTVVVLGAGAELGPARPLLQWGAHVVAVDLPGRAWDGLRDAARRSPGRLTALADPGAAGPGVDLVRDAPRLLAALRERPEPLVLGSYAYADGASHVRAAVAADAVAAGLLRDRPGTVLAALATPTDAFLVPEPAIERSRSAPEPAWARSGRAVSRGRVFERQYPAAGSAAPLHDSLVVQQGPNYALAKRIQRWRAEAARADGGRVSLHVAPPTRTRSVLRSRLLAASYAGASRFGVHSADPATARTLMAALLVRDLRDDEAPAAPGTPLAHPADLLHDAAWHGGLWTAPWTARSVLPLAVVLGAPAAVRSAA